MVAHPEMWWLIRRFGGSPVRSDGSSGDMVAHQDIRWLIREIWWIIRRWGAS